MAPRHRLALDSDDSRHDRDRPVLVCLADMALQGVFSVLYGTSRWSWRFVARGKSPESSR